MQGFCVRGVVKGGQVVLEGPLSLPDGTVVVVTDRDSSEVVEALSAAAARAEADKRKLLTTLNRLDLMDDPEWKAKVEPDRIAYFEKLVLEAAEMRARREAANSEQQVSQSRGTRE